MDPQRSQRAPRGVRSRGNGGPVARWPGGPVARWPGGPVGRFDRAMVANGRFTPVRAPPASLTCHDAGAPDHGRLALAAGEQESVE
ncbi:hypothetical protein EBM89_05835 [Cellulomonas triticagri]|uniref:Uncharacterized protein n=1 Tax=Cellulomonas triticagri TaxID=2483352 RepID=A0A3M2JH06_9CELL|nr:hypothetical protein EBM89_05835 [Cellulomonas triticagri]